jgi:Tol biopolymer transport system component
MLTGPLIVTLAVIVGLAIGVARWSPRTRNFDLEKMEFKKLTNSGNAISVAISPDGRNVVYALRGPEGAGLWVRQVATRSDVQILPPEAVTFIGLTFSPDGDYIYFVRPDKNDPGFKYLYRMPVLGGPARLLVTDIDSAVSFSPDGRQFVYTRGDPPRDASEVRIANADGSGNRLLVTVPGAIAGFQPGAAWSPDGRTIAVSFMHDRKELGFALHLVSIHDANVRELYSSNYTIGRPLWLPTGDALLVPLADRTGREQVWKISFPQGQTQRLTNDLADYVTRDFSAYNSGIDATRDAGTVAAIQSHLVSNIWVTPAADPSGGRQITSGDLPMLEVAAASQGKLVAASGEGDLFIMNVDGGQVTLIEGVHGAVNPASCGRFLLFAALQAGEMGLMRIEASGSNLTRLVRGPIWSPVCSKNLHYVFYGEASLPVKIWRTPAEGGSPTEIATALGATMVSSLTLSPDEKFLAYAYEEYAPVPATKLAVIPVEGGPPVKLLKVPGGIYERGCLRWSADGKSLQFLLTEKGTTNIWEQPLTGGKPKQLTKFRSGRIFDFNWSLDHKNLLLARGEVTSDVVLLSNFR